jgi:hypothetical protein
MENYVQVQAYVTCKQESFTSVLQRLRTALEDLGCIDQQLLTWITQIKWPASENDNFGDVYASPITLAPKNTQPVVCESVDVSLYLRAAVPSIEELPSWVGLNLVFDATLLRASDTGPFYAEVGQTLWQILRILAQAFPELGAYFTNEWQENLSWRVLAEQVGDPWTFELAIFPRKLAKYFKDVPAGFQGTVVEDGFGFVQANRWQTLPWTASED